MSIGNENAIDMASKICPMSRGFYFKEVISQLAETTSVKQFGAKGDGVTDDTLAIQAAIDHVSDLGGGTVFFAPGTYCVKLQAVPTVWASNEDYSCLYIDSDNVSLIGFGNATIKQIPYDGTDMETDVTVLDSKFMRGNLIRIGITGGNTTLNNICIVGLAFDGNILNPAANAGVVTNEDIINFSGWDITHKCLFLKTDVTFTNIRIENCDFKNFRGENIYGGSYNGSKIQILNSTFYNTPAAITVSFACEIAFCTFENTLYQSVENGAYAGQQIHDNRFINVYNAIDIRYFGVGYVLKPSAIYNNHIDIATYIGISITSGINVSIFDNTIIDAHHIGISITNGAAYDATNDGISRNIRILCNRIIANTHTIATGIHFSGGQIESILVENNSFEKTNNALANSYYVDTAITVYPELTSANQIIRNNILTGANHSYDNVIKLSLVSETYKHETPSIKSYCQNSTTGYLTSLLSGKIFVELQSLFSLAVTITYCRYDGTSLATETIYSDTPTTNNIEIPFSVFAKMGHSSGVYLAKIAVTVSAGNENAFKAVCFSECTPIYNVLV